MEAYFLIIDSLTPPGFGPPGFGHLGYGPPGFGHFGMMPLIPMKRFGTKRPNLSQLIV